MQISEVRQVNRSEQEKYVYYIMNENDLLMRQDNLLIKVQCITFLFYYYLIKYVFSKLQHRHLPEDVLRKDKTRERERVSQIERKKKKH